MWRANKKQNWIDTLRLDLVHKDAIIDLDVSNSQGCYT